MVRTGASSRARLVILFQQAPRSRSTALNLGVAADGLPHISGGPSSFMPNPPPSQSLFSLRLSFQRLIPIGVLQHPETFEFRIAYGLQRLSASPRHIPSEPQAVVRQPPGWALGVPEGGIEQIRRIRISATPQ